MKQAFTLIELLIVIAIIGILSAVVITSLNEGRSQASDSSKISGAQQVAKAMELARSNTGEFETYTSSTSAAIGLQEHLSLWPREVEFIDNTGNNEVFCVYALLESDANTNYFVASQQGSGERSSAPTLADCARD
jgi:prepilin-type N-terminal cleavage/methylation domain-containing protein